MSVICSEKLSIRISSRVIYVFPGPELVRMVSVSCPSGPLRKAVKGDLLRAPVVNRLIEGEH